jgi:hypothetical protein
LQNVNHNPKGNYKIECKASRTPGKCEGRIRCHGGVSILCWPVWNFVVPVQFHWGFHPSRLEHHWWHFHLMSEDLCIYAVVLLYRHLHIMFISCCWFNMEGLFPHTIEAGYWQDLLVPRARVHFYYYHELCLPALCVSFWIIWFLCLFMLSFERVMILNVL